MDTSHGFSLSGVDLGGLKKGTPKQGHSLMEVFLGGQVKANHTSEYKLSEIDCGAHEAHTSGCMLSELDWVANDPSFSLYLEHIDHGRDTNPTDYPSSETQENQKDSRLATASSQYLRGAYLKHQKAP